MTNSMDKTASRVSEARVTCENSEVGHLYYIELAGRTAPPYTQQRHVNAILDIASDGTLAGVELIDDMPPPPLDSGTGGQQPVAPDKSTGWLIYKAGRGWYRPNAQGYTNNTADAGRYSHADALSYSHPNGWEGSRDGITIKHESEIVSPQTKAVTITDEMVERLTAWVCDDLLSAYGCEASHLDPELAEACRVGLTSALNGDKP